jgi:hypothetical protein
MENDPFAEIDDLVYELEVTTYNASGLPMTDASLNPEQRAGGRDIIKSRHDKKGTLIAEHSTFSYNGGNATFGIESNHYADWCKIHTNPCPSINLNLNPNPNPNPNPSLRIQVQAVRANQRLYMRYGENLNV